MSLSSDLGFKQGDEVVLVDEGFGHGHWGFRRGRIYTINEFGQFCGDFSGGMRPQHPKKDPVFNYAG